MKKLLALLFSVFFLSSPSVFADDISDFEIEGISIGDSLLDHMTEEEILKQIELNKDRYLHLKEPNKYVDVIFGQDFPTYESVVVMIQNNSINKYVTEKNEKYTILSIRGGNKYIEDFDGCIKERDKIMAVISEKFPNAQKKASVYNSASDPSKKSIVDKFSYILKSGSQVSGFCTNYDETFRIEKNWSDGLVISIDSSAIKNWLGGHK